MQLPRRPAEPAPDVVLALDREFSEILSLLDRSEATRRMVASIPRLAGLEVAWIGEPVGVANQIVLRYPVNVVTDVVDGLVVPAGLGLGGKVITQLRPLWVSDYCASPEITDHFVAQAHAEGVKTMVAVPIFHGGGLAGVLYGAARGNLEIGDRTLRAMEEMASGISAAQVVAERARHNAEVAVHEERRRLALELHDGVGAMLYALGAGLRRLGQEPSLDGRLRHRLAALERQAGEASAALRGSLRVLSAPPDRVALGVALREHCRAFGERTGIAARLIILNDLPVLGYSRVAAVADVVREALLNAEKHAHARSVVVSVFAADRGVNVAVSDDGVGLSLASKARAGLGLAAVSERVARVGGTVRTVSNDDGGFTVQAWVPA